MALPTLIAAAALVASVSGAKIIRSGETIPNQYIIAFKKNVAVEDVKAFANYINAERVMTFGGHFKAAAGVFTPEAINRIAARDDIVDFIEQDQGMFFIFRLFLPPPRQKKYSGHSPSPVLFPLPFLFPLFASAVIRTFGVQRNATWGLDRIDQRSLPLDTLYNYLDSAGNGVKAYVIDTGVNSGHEEFTGRVELGPNFHDSAATSEDDNGHGTHCAGTIGGTVYGVAKQATLIGVKVLGRLGSGSLANVAAGVEWAADEHASVVGARSVASMSLGGSASAVMDAAVVAAIAQGLPVIAASGNSNADGCTFSPARVATLSVNAADSSDRRASFSNFGTCTHIFAPGVDVTSAWIGADDATNTISGTSMACPHVAGAVAVLLGNQGVLTPAQVQSNILAVSTPNLIPNPGTGSPNNYLYSPYN